MVAIDVDFDVFKALTALRETEAVTMNDVIRSLLKLDAEPEGKIAATKGVSFKGMFFPDGTQFQGNYKGRRYTARIVDGNWIDDTSGERRSSPSDAVNKITGTTVNGWRFWRCKRPGDVSWTLLDTLPMLEAVRGSRV